MPENLPDYHPSQQNLWTGRADTPDAQRFFQHVQCMSVANISAIHQKHILLCGFASDAGIIRNQGRAGAALGPDMLKSHLGKLPFHGNYACIDLGNIRCVNDALESAQQQFSHIMNICHQHKKHITIGLGGGHEIAFAHYQGLSAHYPRLAIINFDAHFDLRPWQSGEPGTSGTPFSQIAFDCEQNNRPFHYCCLGIQPHGNTRYLFERANQTKVSFLTAESMQQSSLESQKLFLDEFLSGYDHIYLSFCLDVLSAAYAPGVSAPQPLGLNPLQILPLLKYLLQTGKVVGLDIAELSPPLDEHEKTARLAAMLTAEIIATL